MTLSPLNQQRWQRFRHNRRGYWSLWIFLIIFLLSMGAELIANDKPLLVRYQQRWTVPLLFDYSETDYGGVLATAADYQDPGCGSALSRVAGPYGHRFVSATALSTLPPRCPSPLRPLRRTGSARMPTAAT